MPTVAQHAAERLVVDLHCEPTSLLTQPTACFHVATALAIMAAYVHALALEENGSQTVNDDRVDDHIRKSKITAQKAMEELDLLQQNGHCNEHALTRMSTWLMRLHNS